MAGARNPTAGIHPPTIALSPKEPRAAAPPELTPSTDFRGRTPVAGSPNLKNAKHHRRLQTMVASFGIGYI